MTARLVHGFRSWDLIASPPATSGWTVGEYIQAAGAVLGIVVAAITILAAFRGWYRRTVGRRHDLSMRIARLGTGAQLDFFTAVLGEPPAMRRSVTWKATKFDDRGLGHKIDNVGHESVYWTRLAYVQTLTDADGTVIAFSVTTRHWRFRPRFQCPGGSALPPTWWDRNVRRRSYHYVPGFNIRLGKSRLVGLGEIEQAGATRGARRVNYWERHYYGNPGHYQTYIFAVSDAGIDTPNAPMQGLFAERPDPRWNCDGGVLPGEEVDAYRRLARINTICILGPALIAEDYPLTIGADADAVRTLDYRLSGYPLGVRFRLWIRRQFRRSESG